MKTNSSNQAKQVLNKITLLSPFSYQSELKKAVKGCKTLLDIGCGSDSPVKMFSKKIYCVGVDAFEPYIQESKAKSIHNKYVISEVGKISNHFNKNSFDCVVALDLIEHLSKKEGLQLLDDMEKISSKKIIIFTPNGFLSQREYENNPWQVHKSGWTVEEMRKRGYKVIGISGWKPLRSTFASPKFRPRFFWSTISEISQIFTRNSPKKAFQILCIKEK